MDSCVCVCVCVCTSITKFWLKPIVNFAQIPKSNFLVIPTTKNPNPPLSTLAITEMAWHQLVIHKTVKLYHQ